MTIMVEHYFDDQEPIAMKNTKGEALALREYLETVARLTEQFAGKFGCAKQGYILGLHHAIGMYSSPFQRAVWDEKKPVPSFRKEEQATASAKELAKISPSYLPLAMAAAGQYSSLADYGHPRLSTAGDGTFCGRLKTETPDISIWKQELETEGIEVVPTYSFVTDSDMNLAFYTRMMYSCLTDAIQITTETFQRSAPTILQTPERAIASATYTATEKVKNLERIIYVVPSPAAGRRKKEELAKQIDAERIYVEGEDPEETVTWHAPVVITTQKSFYTTAYGANKKVLTKLHNAAKAAIIVQDPYTIPTGITSPFLKALAQLADHYGSVVRFDGIAAALGSFERAVPQMHFRLFSAAIPQLGKSVSEKVMKVETAQANGMDVSRLDLLLLHFKHRREEGKAIIDLDNEEAAEELRDGLQKIGKSALLLSNRMEESEVADQLKREAADIIITTPFTRHLLCLCPDTFPVVYCEEAGLEELLQLATHCGKKLYLFRSKESLDPADAPRIGWMREAKRIFGNPLRDVACDFYFDHTWTNKATDQDQILRMHEKGYNATILPFKAIARTAARTADLMYGAD